jgi:ABC-2 type transport system ATP-binding protein
MIEISNLSVHFGKTTALDDLTLEIERGESILLAGANGSGKTTLLRSIAGVLDFNSGEISVDNLNKVEAKKKTAYIPASLSLYDSMRVKEAIRFHGSFFHPFDYKQIGGFQFKKDRRVGSFSKGEKTLFYLSLALSASPDYLMVDDVIHFLDPHLREIFINSILELIETNKLTIILASQAFFEIQGIPERLIILDKGKPVINDQIEKIKGSFVKVLSKSVPSNLPVIYQKDWGETKEFYIYPFFPDQKKDIEGKVEYLSLSEILRAFIGGEYDYQ